MRSICLGIGNSKENNDLPKIKKWKSSPLALQCMAEGARTCTGHQKKTNDKTLGVGSLPSSVQDNPPPPPPPTLTPRRDALSGDTCDAPLRVSHRVVRPRRPVSNKSLPNAVPSGVPFRAVPVPPSKACSPFGWCVYSGMGMWERVCTDSQRKESDSHRGREGRGVDQCYSHGSHPSAPIRTPSRRDLHFPTGTPFPISPCLRLLDGPLYLCDHQSFLWKRCVGDSRPCMAGHAVCGR